jgi:hypothetical protein
MTHNEQSDLFIQPRIKDSWLGPQPNLHTGIARNDPTAKRRLLRLTLLTYPPEASLPWMVVAIDRHDRKYHLNRCLFSRAWQLVDTWKPSCSPHPTAVRTIQRGGAWWSPRSRHRVSELWAAVALSTRCNPMDKYICGSGRGPNPSILALRLALHLARHFGFPTTPAVWWVQMCWRPEKKKRLVTLNSTTIGCQ